MEKTTKPLHIVMFPWLAMGHLIPFFRLSQLLAQKGHKISFISTPRNLSRLPKIPQNLKSLITLVPFPLPKHPKIPSDAESSMDVTNIQQQPLKHSFDRLKQPVVDFLRSASPDWMIYDYASHWLPPIAADLGISRAFFGLFTAAFFAFIGPPSELAKDERSTPEDFTVAPPWVPSGSKIFYRLHETLKFMERRDEDEDNSGPPDTVRFAVTVDQSDVLLIRTCEEFEPDSLGLVRKLLNKPVIPVGFLPPGQEAAEDDSSWIGTKHWLDNQKPNSVIFVALGTESVLTQDELTELALGLEKSELPFFWVLRNPPGSTRSVLDSLPSEFTNRVKVRRVIHEGWAPQVEILTHNSVGGFLTHCGWNSVVEGLRFGRVLVLFPVSNDQGLNARLLEEKELGVEIRRDEKDGSFRSEWVAESVRSAMVEESGELWRRKAKKIEGLIGDKDRNEGYMEKLCRHLELTAGRGS